MQETTQPSPLALLAATCSKIGAPGETETCSSTAGAPVRIVGQNQAGDVVTAPQNWVIDASGAVKQTAGAGTTSAILSPQFVQQSPQVLTTAVQGGNNVAYNVLPSLPSYQTITVDGQEAIFIPANGGQGQTVFTGAPGGQAILSPSGQIIRTPGSVQGSNLMVNVGGNLVNVTNLANVSSLQPNTVQSAVRSSATQNMIQQIQTIPQVQSLQNIIQIPVSTPNGQTVLQTFQVPYQTQLQQSSQFATLPVYQQPTQQLATSSLTNVQPQQQVVEITQPSIPTTTTSPKQETTQQERINETTSIEENKGYTTSNIIVQSNTSGASNITYAPQQMPVFVYSNPNIIQGSNGQTFIPISQGTTSTQNVVSVAPAQLNPVTSTVPSTVSAAAPTNVIQNVVGQHQLIQNINQQQLANIQLAGQNQVLTPNAWLSALNMSTMRPNNLQTIQVQSLQGLTNLQAIQNIQGIQGVSSQGQIISNIGGMTVTPSGMINTLGGATMQQMSPQVQAIQALNAQLVGGNPGGLQTIAGAQMFSKYIIRYICMKGDTVQPNWSVICSDLFVSSVMTDICHVTLTTFLG